MSNVILDENGNILMDKDGKLYSVDGGSGNYVRVKTKDLIPPNFFILNGDQEFGYNVEANLGDISNKEIHWDWNTEQVIDDPQLGQSLNSIQIGLNYKDIDSFDEINRNFTLYINIPGNALNIGNGTTLYISMPYLWTFKNDISWLDVSIENGNLDKYNYNYCVIIFENIEDFRNHPLILRIDVDNNGFGNIILMSEMEM